MFLLVLVVFQNCRFCNKQICPYSIISAFLFSFQCTYSFLFPSCNKMSNNSRLSLVVGLSGLEPPTSRLSGVRSNRLSYKPIFRLEQYGVSSLHSFLSECLKVLLSTLTEPFCFNHEVFHLPLGGDERDRTDDPLLAKQVLSQLSYTPIFTLNTGRCSPFHFPNESPILYRAFKIKQHV